MIGMIDPKKIVFIFIYVVEKVARINQSGSIFPPLSLDYAATGTYSNFVYTTSCLSHIAGASLLPL